MGCYNFIFQVLLTQDLFLSMTDIQLSFLSFIWHLTRKLIIGIMDCVQMFKKPTKITAWEMCLKKETTENYQKNIWLSDHGLQLLQYIRILPPMDQSSLLRRKNTRRNKQDGLLTFQSTFVAKNNFKNRSY